MPDIKATLTLNPSGTAGCIPDQNPWKVTHGWLVEIFNDSGSEQTLSKISKGALSPTPHDEITLAAGARWQGRVGNANDYSYHYNDGLDDLGMRTGTIKVS